MSDPEKTEEGPARGRVWLLDDNPRDVEIVFDFPIHEELNDAVKRLPKRWFNWRTKHWRVPADPRVAKSVERVLDRFPGLEPTPEVRAWLADSDRWRAVVSVVSYRGAGAFILRTLAGEAPPELNGAADAAEGRHLLPFSMENADLLYELDGVQLDDLARGCARELSAGRAPAPRRAEHRGGRRRRARGHDLHHLGPAARARVPQALRGPPDRPAGPLLRARRLVGHRRAGRPGAGHRPHGVRGGQPEGRTSTSGSGR